MEFIKKRLISWLYVDSRTLALFRIIFGFWGLFDVLRRYSIIDVFYSDAGMNFRRQVTSKYSTQYFSLLDYFHSSVEVQLFFILTALCFFFLIIGYRTRLFQFLAAMGLISIHNAAVILENGGDMVMNNYLVWTLFLPLGTSWSVDSIRKSVRQNPEYDSNDLNKSVNSISTRIFHFAYLACLIQLAMIYFYNNINKTGHMWSDGTAIHYMYQLETFLTPLGEWLASTLSINIIKFLTFMTLYIEILSPITILSPIFQPWLRRITIVVFMFFHLIIGISLNIGMFSWAMMAVLLLLLGQEDMNILKNILSRFYQRKYTIFYDRDCGFCHLTARILKRMDGFVRLTWADRLTEGNKPKNIDILLETTIVVWDPKTDEIWTRHKGFSRIISALPLGFLFAWILLIPGLEKLFGFIYDLISNNRTYVSKITGLPACGIIQEDSTSPSIKEDNPIITLSRRGIWIVSNIVGIVIQGFVTGWDPLRKILNFQVVSQPSPAAALASQGDEEVENEEKHYSDDGEDRRRRNRASTKATRRKSRRSRNRRR